MREKDYIAVLACNNFSYSFEKHLSFFHSTCLYLRTFHNKVWKNNLSSITYCQNEFLKVSLMYSKLYYNTHAYQQSF